MAASKKVHKGMLLEIASLREMTVEDLQKKLSEEQEKLMRDRFQHASANLEDTAILNIRKKQIARIKTIMNEKRKRLI